MIRSFSILAIFSVLKSGSSNFSDFPDYKTFFFHLKQDEGWQSFKKEPWIGEEDTNSFFTSEM